jgi:hypothetical protein
MKELLSLGMEEISGKLISMPPGVVGIRGAKLFLNVRQFTEQSRRERRISLLESPSNQGTFNGAEYLSDVESPWSWWYIEA